MKNLDFDNNSEACPLFEQTTAIIVAGGKSRRMGTDKAMLSIRGRPIIEHIHNQLQPHFDRILISAADHQRYSFVGVDIVVDEIPDLGPVMGIMSALNDSDSELNFVVACDMPEINIKLITRMLEIAGTCSCDAVVPRHLNGGTEPLFAVYKKSVVASLRKMLDEGERRATRIFDYCETCYLDINESISLMNLNTPEEYRVGR